MLYQLTPNQLAVAKAMSEAKLQANFTDAAEKIGWRWHHETDSRKSPRGLPDIILVHVVQRRIIFVELKNMTRKETLEQLQWRHDVADAGGEAYLFRPTDWMGDLIQDVLKGDKVLTEETGRYTYACPRLGDAA